MSSKFKKIGIISKRDDANMKGTLLELVRFLDERKLEVLLDHTSQALVAGEPGKPIAADTRQMGESCDLVFVVGGDGTMLAAARSLVDYEVPIIGINLGRLGFLTDISPVDMVEKLTQILAGEYEEERRAMLNAQRQAGR